MNLLPTYEFILKTQIKPLREDLREEAYKILVEETFDEFLEFANDNLSLSGNALKYLLYDCYVFEVDEDGEYTNYNEVNPEKRKDIVNILFDGKINKYGDKYKEN
jgi:hypothetical protein